MRIFVLPLCMMFLCSAAIFAEGFEYPAARKVDQKDDYFGTVLEDPYRWMETDSPELRDWIDAENRLTESYLETIPFRDDLRQRLTKLVDYPKHGTPWTKAGRLFFFKNDGLQNQSVLYVVDSYADPAEPNAPAMTPRVLLDPNTLSEDGTVALQTTAISKDGKTMAYAISRSGSDWNEVFVLDIATGEPLIDHLTWVKFSGLAWHGNGFYYSRFDAPEEGAILTAKNDFHKVYYHRLGTDQSADTLVFTDTERPQRVRASTDRDEQFLFLYGSETTYGNTLFFKSLTGNDAGFTAVVDDFKSSQGVVAVIDGMFYILTDRDAPNQRLVKVDPKKTDVWIDVIPETEFPLTGVRRIGGHLIVTYSRDAADEVFVYDLNGKKLRAIELPTLGITGFSGEQDSDLYFQSFTSYTYPTVVYACNMTTGNRIELFPSGVDFDKDAFVTERVWYTNSAGRKAPIFLTYKKDLEKNGENPTLLYGYGGFNISVRPSFSAFRIPFLEQGGVYAHVVLRGGGEYGETWYKSGTKLQKQNVFDDFIAAAEFLIAEKYTSPQKLACQGGSNGGLLVAAVVLQRPDLFAVAVPAVGVLDMLRYHKFTIGAAWATDYGTGEESKEMFESLLKYSPLHNVKHGVEYPAILVTTSDHDDRVVPAHSFKFTAEMQAKTTSKNPALIRIETKAGHGAGKPISKVIDESTDVWSFIMHRLGMKPAFK